jgi:hypothetical protein
MLTDFYLTEKTTAVIGTANFSILSLEQSKSYFAEGHEQLLEQGFSVAVSKLTEYAVLVKPLKNVKWSCAWGKQITEFKAYEMETTTTPEGVITAALGDKRKNLKTDAAILKHLN